MTLGLQERMLKIYSKFCFQGGYLKKCLYDHVKFLEWVWCDECFNEYYRCFKYKPEWRSMDSTCTGCEEFTFNFINDFDYDCDFGNSKE